MSESCGECKFSASGHQEVDGLVYPALYCRRHPPQIASLYGALRHWSGFPKVSRDDWCGEFVRKDDAMSEHEDLVDLDERDGT